jgi:hypothetical protein
MNPSGKVLLVIIDVPRNLLIPLVSRNPNDILVWNWKITLHLKHGKYDYIGD